MLDLGSEVNAITPAFTSKLGFKICSTNVRAQKIDGSTLQTFGIVLTSFQIKDKFGQARFFQESFLLVDTTVKVMLGMLFLTLSNDDMSFLE